MLLEPDKEILPSILDDQPWRMGRSARQYPDEDPLGFQPLARRIVRVILRAEPNLTVGIYGDWGAGKTSFMRMMEDLLRREDDVITVWFNAWDHHNAVSPLLGLATSIQQQIEEDKPSGVFWKKTEAIMKSLTGVSFLGVGVTWDWGETNRLAEANKKFAKALRDLKQLGNELKPAGSTRLPRFVVFVDDLDRCSPEVSIRLLESIKLVFGEPGFVFVLGMMPQVIAAHVSRSPALQDCAGTTGREYLDKMIQLDFRIPAPSLATTASLVEYLCREMGNNSLPEHVVPFASILAHVGGTIGTPRSIKRFINEFALELLAWEELAADQPMTAAVEAVRPQPNDIACAQTLRYCWPSLYRNLTRRRDTVLLQLREAAGVSEDPVLLARRLTEVAQDIEDEAEAKRIRDGIGIRTFLRLERVSRFLADQHRATRSIEGAVPTPATGSELLPMQEETSAEELGDPARRFHELSIQFQVEPSERTARQAVDLVMSDLPRLNRTTVGNTAVRISESGYPHLGRRMFEKMDEEGLLDDWRHASQFAVMLLTDDNDDEAAGAIVDRFRDQAPFENQVDQQRWTLCLGLLGQRIDFTGYVERLRQKPDDMDAMLALQATLVGAKDVDEAVAVPALEALSIYTGSTLEASEKVKMVRATGDALARGSDSVAHAGAALFWALKGTPLWEDYGTVHNLANVTFADLQDAELAVDLWTIAYCGAGRTDQQIQRPFSMVLAKTDPPAALAVLNGKPLPDEQERLAKARRSVEEAAWSDDKVVEKLVMAGGTGPWDGVLAAIAEQRADANTAR